MSRARSKTYSTRAIVLRTHPLGEADRIVVLATREHGLVRAVAKGVRKPSSRFGARLEPFMVSDIQASEGRGLHTVTQAVSVAGYGVGIVQDMDAFLFASAIAELAEVLGEGDASVPLYDLLLGAFAALARAAYPPQLIFDAFAIRALARAGWDMSVDACAVTGSVEGLNAFSPSHGGVIAARVPGASALRPGTRELLSSLKSGDWSSALGSDEAARRQAHGLTKSFLGWHLERTMSSLSRFDRQT
ncbi:DNA repair protein RecO [Falsarthrobacter nasiphocae]|uniref:DNA repair protein RecO n=1 Tax=Falsarthrobacter nasiphocae TaxID=189863 RepID=A0AAE3YFA4_9MICC|nr:DNA repair protein RecO [Falsarthrobacter nasiphocae]MDR6891079.1 DNA repair protein RecO (recombination protein O) [Falsarthrobacter nasiphocae]